MRCTRNSILGGSVGGITVAAYAGINDGVPVDVLVFRRMEKRKERILGRKMFLNPIVS